MGGVTLASSVMTLMASARKETRTAAGSQRWQLRRARHNDAGGCL